MKSNEVKSKQLGMNYSTAQGRLRKRVLLKLLRRLGENFCFQCGGEIETEAELSMDHKEPWLHVSNDLFWDLDNIAFSHLSCNIKAGRRPRKGELKHPSASAYRKGCRCTECKNIHKIRGKKYRASKRGVVV